MKDCRKSCKRIYQVLTTATNRIKEEEHTGVSKQGAPAILCHHVGKRFGVEAPVLQGIDLAIEPGSFVALLGQSGSGKSTFLRMLADLSPVSEGVIQIGGQTPAQFLHRTAFMFQDPTLLPWKRVLQNVELPLRIMGMPKEERRSIARYWLEQVGLQEAETRFPRQLSGGMKMRVSLARMLVRKPDLILYDEPLSALDEMNRQRLNELISDLYAKQRKTSLFVTHSVAEALFLSGRVLLLGGKPGQIVGDFQLPWEFPRRASLRSTREFTHWVEIVSKCLWEAAGSEGGKYGG